MNYSTKKNGRKPTKHETSSSPEGCSNQMWKKNKNCKIFPDISKMTDRRFNMILMHDEEAQCPYCEDWNSVSTED